MSNTEPNPYWPCLLVEHSNYYSVILTNFHYFDDYFGKKEAGGYTIESLAKKLAKEKGLKGIRFDSEAGMFCAFSPNKSLLLELCLLLREIAGNEADFTPAESTQPDIPLQEAEKLLMKGFIKDTDAEVQALFLQHVPYPALTKKQAEYLAAISEGTDDEKIYAARRINSEARTKTRKWEHYLSHPTTVTRILGAIDNEPNAKLQQELIWALVFICDRHMPDLRALPYFVNSLASKNAQTRLLGLWGLKKLYTFPIEPVLPLAADRSEKVRKQAEFIIENKTEHREFPSWMFSQTD